MKILSIDVGIKNLAYCLFYVNTAKTKVEIDSWDVINITDEKKTETCCGTLKNKSQCTHQSKYYYETKYYCKTHAKQSPYIIPSSQYKLSKITKQKLQELKNFCLKHLLDTTECKVKKDYISVIETFFKNKVLQPIQQENASNVDLVTLGRNINNKFNTIFENHTIDTVIIENQISPIANRMKTLQGMISQYFIMKGVSTIDFISSSNKLKEFTTSKKRLSYNERKKLGIQVIRQLSESMNFLSTWLEFFDKHKKKDDLADCFLQGYYYLKAKELMK